MSIQGNSVGGLLPTAEQVGAATPADVQKAAPVNLLDNSDFTNPVNQRGKTTYVDLIGYGIDRWRCPTATTVTIGNDGVKFTHYMEQVIETKRLSGLGVVTFAVMFLDKLRVGTLDLSTAPTGTENRVYVGEGVTLTLAINNEKTEILAVFHSNVEKTVKWAALYEGEYTEETLPEYHSNGYGVELSECQRYYQQELMSTYTVAGIFDGAGCLDVVIPLKTTMRTIPTVNCIAYASGVAQGDNTIRLTVENTDPQTVSCSYQWKSTNFICPRYINGSYAWKKAIVTLRYTATADF